MRWKFIAAAISTALVAACTPKIDGSSESDLRNSLAKVIASVPESERQALTMDIQFLAPEIDGAVIVARLQPQNAGESLAKATANIDGLTAAEIRDKAPIARALAKAKMKADNIAYLEKKIASEQEKIAGLERSSSDLTKFKATVVRTFPIAKDDPTGSVELDVVNGMTMRAHRAWYLFTVEGLPDRVGSDAVLYPGDIPAGGSGRITVPLPSGVMSFDRTSKVTAVEVVMVEGDEGQRAANRGKDIDLVKFEIQKLQEQLQREQAQ